MKIRIAIAVMLLFCLATAGLGQEPGKTVRASGRVTAVTADSITVRPGANLLTVAVDSSTRITGKGVGTKIRELKAANKSPQVIDLVNEHDVVRVEYHDLGGGKLRATKIDVRVRAFKQP